MVYFSKKGVERKQKTLVSKLPPEINENYRFLYLS